MSLSLGNLGGNADFLHLYCTLWPFLLKYIRM